MYRLTGIRIYPVKGMRGRWLDSGFVEPWGLLHDRRWLVVTPDGMQLTQREAPLLARIDAAPAPEGLVLTLGQSSCPVPVPGSDAPTMHVTVWRSLIPAAVADASAATWLSQALGLPCLLVHMADPAARPTNPRFSRPGDRVSFADGYPLLVASESSLADLNERLDAPVPMTRFRPNLVVAGAPAFEEDRWAALRIGERRFRAVKPCARCVVITIDQETGTAAARRERAEPLRTLARYRQVDEGVIFGMNLIPDDTGPINLGEPVEILQ